jgi:hypothetical protein
MNTKLIEDWLPPVAYRLLLWIYLWAIRGHGWHLLYGRYPTLADVPATPGWQDSDWYAELSIKRIGDLACIAPTARRWGRIAAAAPDGFRIAQPESRCAAVLDFGGGAASGLREIFRACTKPGLSEAPLYSG